MRKILIALFVVSPLFLFAAEKYLQVVAHDGDGVYSLLRKYELEQHYCNHKKFYALNDLQEDAHLKTGKSYFLPILLYKYNGRTIRSTIGVNNWALAKKIEAYNGEMLKKGLRKKAFKQDKELWVAYHILNCPEKDMNLAEGIKIKEDENPVKEASALRKGGKNIYPIFGKKYEEVHRIDKLLSGKVYYIVSGHGGPDPGATSRKAGHGLYEDEYAYDVALRLARHLIEHSAIVYVIVRDPNDGIRDGKYFKHDEDEVVWGKLKIPHDQKARLRQRAGVINKLYYRHLKQGLKDQKVVVIHVDSGNKGHQTDVHFYYYPGNQAGKKLALTVFKTLKQKYKRRYHGKVDSRDLHMLRETKPTALYIELANIRNSFDHNRILKAENREALAKWFADGLLKAK